VFMSCRGICIRHRAQKPFGSSSRYAAGQKRCQVCEIFINWDGMRCPCCANRFRTRSRAPHLRAKMLIARIK